MTSSTEQQPLPGVVVSSLDRLMELSEEKLRAVEPAAQFLQAVNAVSEKIRQIHDIEESARPSLILTHYTSLDALFAMLQDPTNRLLRLYDTVHLNDPHEGVATQEGKALKNFLAGKLDDSPLPTSSIDQDHFLSRFSTAYLLSFLASCRPHDDLGDNLVFWRLYGRDGRGCSISFLPFLTPWPASVRNAIRRVRYNPVDMSDYSSEIVKLLDLFVRFGRLDELELSAQHKLSQALPLLEECLARRFLTKDPPYRPEREVRLVQFARPYQTSGSREPHVELVRGVLRHYLKDDDLKLEKLVDSRTVLCVGPAVPHPEDAKQALRRLWANSGLPPIYVKTSSIEYRPSN